ncbi:DUF3320 domain-containing protein [Kineococcus sp. NPDC059986]|uniref:DUF3320 domain-containing protein n=1 Tax=Kineococcus sp. NPDC059986 TaxID=3155538 RepID=UPI00344CCD35
MSVDTRVQEAMQRQLEQWRERLLDLTRRQRLLYFAHVRTGSLEIGSPAASQVLAVVDADRATLVTDGVGLTVSNKTEEEIPGAGRRIAQKAQQDFADRGVWTLHLGLGMLHWVDPFDGKPVDSPLVLVPVQLTRSGSNAPHRVRRAEDAVVVNPALALKLERDFGIDLPPVDEFSPDVSKYLAQVEALVARHAGWSTSERTVLTNFTFQKEAIYRDLEENAARIAEHPLVQLVALGPNAPAARELPFEPIRDDADIDAVVAPESMHTILDADSSQRRCIIAAREGKSFVMDGPPGTGKSQTIANIIAELMAMGRSVLFVSEKAAALDVVNSRLQDRGLANFLLELHSHTAGRREVAQAFAAELTSRPRARSAFGATDRNALVRARQRLSSYAAAMNETRPGLELSLHTVLGQIALLDASGRFGSADTAAGRDLTAARRAEAVASAAALARSWRPVSEGEGFLWRGLRADVADSRLTERLRTTAQAAQSAAELLRERVRAVDEDLPLGLPVDTAGAQRRADLLHALGDAPSVPTAWLTSGSLAPVEDRVLQLQSLTDAFQEAAERAVELTGERWAEVDADQAPVLDTAMAPGAWSPVPTATAADLHHLHEVAAACPQRALDLRDDARRLAALLGVPAEGLSLHRAARLADLGRLAEQTALPESAWLNPTVQNALQESRRVLEQLVGVVRQRQEAVAAVFTPAVLELDLVGLRTRFHETHTGLRKLSGAARADKAALKAVTVAQRVTKETIAQLDEAVEWQKAERALTLGADEHADRLGGYWHGTDTDFGRLTKAVETALTAVQLAGDEVDPRALAGQLSRGATPDPHLTTVARRVATAVGAWRVELTAVAPDVVDFLSELPLEDLAGAGSSLAERVRPAVDVVEAVDAVAGRPLTLADCRRALDAVGAAATAQAQVLDTYDRDATLLGDLYTGTDTQWSAVRSALDWCTRVRELVGGPVPPSVAEHLHRPALAARDVEDPLRRWNAAVDALVTEFSDERARELHGELSASLDDAHGLLTEMAASVDRDAPEWCDWSTRRHEVSAHGVSAVVDALVVAHAPAAAVPTEVERALLVAWVDGVTLGDDRLRDYRADDRDALVDTFRRLDGELVTNAHTAVVQACVERRPRTVIGDAAVIVREAEKKTRHIPVRDLLTRAGAVAQQLKPCFMMSPLAVSQYLPSTLHFDVVIFDEASQVAPWDAVNCIYRGDQLIVAGDEKQLPPTAFFSASQEDQEDDDADEMLEDFESVLKQCKGSGAMTALPLTWHYRSRHEDLITFSNVQFYDSELNTFPGARFDSPDLGVASYLVPGVYDRGGRRDNVVEAQKVVDRVVHHHREHPNLTVGVVALSTPQAEAIERELERRADDDPSLEPLLDRSNRLGGFFVKNLENVQGDERDIIIFSVGYGPDAADKVTMNFGPLTKKGGWRRLNVAVTRARRRVEVVTSLTHGRIDPGANESHRALQKYLHFAEKGPQALQIDLSGSFGDAESPFEEDVLAAIRSLGYEGVPQVGTAGYRIDIAIKHPEKAGEHLLGVECDGAAYHSAKAARDRDRLRQNVLEGLGWRIHRIWGLSWYHDRAGQVEGLRRGIEDALRGAPIPVPAPVPVAAEVVVEEVELAERPAWAVPYERFVGGRRTARWDLASPEARPHFRRYFEELLLVEAPIHEDLLLQRFRDDWGVARLGPRIKANALDALEGTVVAGNRVMRNPRGFYSHRPVEMVRVPAGPGTGTDRPLEHVSSREVRLAVQLTVADAGSIGERELVDAVRKLFGWGRSSGDVAAAVSSTVHDLVERGDLQRLDGDRLAARR